MIWMWTSRTEASDSFSLMVILFLSFLHLLVRESWSGPSVSSLWHPQDPPDIMVDLGLSLNVLSY